MANKDTVTSTEVRLALAKTVATAIANHKAGLEQLAKKEKSAKKRLSKKDGNINQTGEGSQMAGSGLVTMNKNAGCLPTAPSMAMDEASASGTNMEKGEPGLEGCPGCGGQIQYLGSLGGTNHSVCGGCGSFYAHADQHPEEMQPTMKAEKPMSQQEKIPMVQSAAEKKLPGAVMPDDKKSKEIPADGSGGDVNKGKALKKGSIPMGRPKPAALPGVVPHDPLTQKKFPGSYPGFKPAAPSGLPQVGGVHPETSKALADVKSMSKPHIAAPVVAKPMVKDEVKGVSGPPMSAEYEDEGADRYHRQINLPKAGFLKNLIAKFHGIQANQPKLDLGMATGLSGSANMASRYANKNNTSQLHAAAAQKHSLAASIHRQMAATNPNTKSFHEQSANYHDNIAAQHSSMASKLGGMSKDEMAPSSPSDPSMAMNESDMEKTAIPDGKSEKAAKKNNMCTTGCGRISGDSRLMCEKCALKRPSWRPRNEFIAAERAKNAQAPTDGSLEKAAIPSGRPAMPKPPKAPGSIAKGQTPEDKAAVVSANNQLKGFKSIASVPTNPGFKPSAPKVK